MGTEDKDIDVMHPEDGGMAGGAAETAEASGNDRSVSEESEISEISGATIGATADVTAVGKPRSVVDSALDIAKERAEVVHQIVDETAGIDDRIRMWRDWMDEHKLETKEQREKREKRERSKRLMGAIGDGLRALGNLYFTTQYAPDMYNHEKDSMARKADSAIEKARKDREAQQEQYMKFALAIGDARREKARTIRGIEDAAEKRKIARDNAARDALLFPLKRSKVTADAATAGYKRDIAKVEADMRPALVQSKIDKNNRSNTGGKSGGKSGGSAGQHTVWRINPQTGKKEYREGFKTESAARNYAETHNDEGWRYSTTPSTSTRTQTETGTETTRDVSSQESVDWE